MAHLVGGNFGHPAKLLLGLSGVAQQGVDLGGAKVPRVDAHCGLPGLQGGGLAARDLFHHGNLMDAPPFKPQRNAQRLGAPVYKLPHTKLLAGGDYKVLGLVLLQHKPLHAHIVLAWPQSRRASRLPMYRQSSSPWAMLASPRVTFRVTNVSPRRGLSW